MSSTPPDDLALGYALVELCQSTGARSSWIQVGSELVESNLAFAEARVSQMAQLINEMSSSYNEVGRDMETIFFGFANQFLLVVCEGQYRLALLFPGNEKPVNSNIVKARAFIREQRPNLHTLAPERVPPPRGVEIIEAEVSNPSDSLETWESFYPQIKSLLTQVVNSGQAQRLIDRTLKEHACDAGVPHHKIADLSRTIVSKIPHRGKQASIMAELSDHLDSLGLT